jgi:hypothetical protein
MVWRYFLAVMRLPVNGGARGVTFRLFLIGFQLFDGLFLADFSGRKWRSFQFVLAVKWRICSYFFFRLKPVVIYYKGIFGLKTD